MAHRTRVVACLIAGLVLAATVPSPVPAAAADSVASCKSNAGAAWPLPGEYEGLVKAEWKRPNQEQGPYWQDGTSTITGTIWFDVRDDRSAKVTLTLDSQTLLGNGANWSIDETLHAVFFDAEAPAPTELSIGYALTLRGEATGVFRAKDNPIPNKWIEKWKAFGASQDPQCQEPLDIAPAPRVRVMR